MIMQVGLMRPESCLLARPCFGGRPEIDLGTLNEETFCDVLEKAENEALPFHATWIFFFLSCNTS